MKSQARSGGLQNAGLNMLRATPNPLKQWSLLMRPLCLPYSQKTGVTHKFPGRGICFYGNTYGRGSKGACFVMFTMDGDPAVGAPVPHSTWTGEQYRAAPTGGYSRRPCRPSASPRTLGRAP